MWRFSVMVGVSLISTTIITASTGESVVDALEILNPGALIRQNMVPTNEYPSDHVSTSDEVHSVINSPTLRTSGTDGVVSRIIDYIGSGLLTFASELLRELPFMHSDKSKLNDDSPVPIDGEQIVASLLGWKRFPQVVMKVDPGEKFLKHIQAFEYEPVNVVLTLSRVEQAVAIANEPEPRSEDLDWVSSIESHLTQADIALPSYDAMVEDLSMILSQEPSKKVKTILDQIAADAERHGYPANAFGNSISEESLMKDCTEVCSVYGLVFDPKFRYLQGMMDYCVAFKMIGKLDNEAAFAGLVAMTRVIAQLNVPGYDLADRSFFNGQLYLHLFSELNGLSGEGNIFETMDTSAIREDNMCPGHILANQFDLFTIAAGFRANPGRIRNPSELEPVVDLIVRKGRPALVALFFAGLELNRPIMEDLVRAGRWAHAVRFVADPFAQGSEVTVQDLVTLADSYLQRRTGVVSFATAVRIIDILALDYIPPAEL